MYSVNPSWNGMWLRLHMLFVWRHQPIAVQSMKIIVVILSLRKQLLFFLCVFHNSFITNDPPGRFWGWCGWLDHTVWVSGGFGKVLQILGREFWGDRKARWQMNRQVYHLAPASRNNWRWESLKTQGFQLPFFNDICPPWFLNILPKTSAINW